MRDGGFSCFQLPVLKKKKKVRKVFNRFSTSIRVVTKIHHSSIDKIAFY